MTTSRRVEARDAGEYRGALSIVGLYASHCFQCILSRRAVSFRDVSQYNQGKGRTMPSFVGRLASYVISTKN